MHDLTQRGVAGGEIAFGVGAFDVGGGPGADPVVGCGGCSRCERHEGEEGDGEQAGAEGERWDGHGNIIFCEGGLVQVVGMRWAWS